MAKGNVLIIDDEELICKSLIALLKEKGYDSCFALTGEGGIKMAQDGLFDIVLVDLKLPDIDGLSVLKEIKKADPSAVAIIITGYPSEKSIEEALQSGAYDYVTKPFDVTKLSFVMERAVAYRKSLLEGKDGDKESEESDN